MGMDHQDWNAVVIQKKLTEKEQKQKYGVETKVKVTQKSSTNKAALDNETETFHHKMTPKDKLKEITKLRNQKGMSQKELALKCNLTPAEISKIESGTAIYDANKGQKILQKLRK